MSVYCQCTYLYVYNLFAVICGFALVCTIRQRKRHLRKKGNFLCWLLVLVSWPIIVLINRID